MSDTFHPAVHGEAARRQLRVSALMVACLALAALLSAFLTPAGSKAPARVEASEDFAGRLIAPATDAGE